MAGQDAAELLVSELFDSWYSKLVGYVMRSTGSIELAEDLVQEAFLELCRELKAGVKIENPKGWTLCVVRHQISKYLRATKDRGIVFESFDDHPTLKDFRQISVDPVDLAGPKPFSEMMRLLTAREEEIVLLRLEGLKYREIATQLNIRSSSIKTLIARALRKLREASDPRTTNFAPRKERHYETR
jgi:RNA polymerase sigma factor (sigma-70 family)